MSQDINEQLVLISGESGTGKSASLRNLRNQDRWLYLNCEAGKRLPFKNTFQTHTITDPYQVFEAFDASSPGGALHGAVDGIIVDSITFLMDMYESLYVLPSNDTQKAWSDYAQYFKRLMQHHVASSDKAVIFTGHTRHEYNEKAMRYRVTLSIKGAVGKSNGAEAYFSTVVSTKAIELTQLETQDQELLHITPEEETLGFKHVFQTQLTKDTVGERIRSPMGMFQANQSFIDNDAQALLDHLHAYYTV